MPAVHVVIVNWNRWQDTVECLESIFRSSYPDTRVIVVDNGSSDGSIEKLKCWASGSCPYTQPPDSALSHLSWPPVDKPVRTAVLRVEQVEDARETADLPALTLIASERNTGFAVANNLAMRAALARCAGGYTLLINNDMVIERDTIAHLVRALDEAKDVAAMGGLVLDYREPDRVQMAGGALRTGLGLVDVFGAGLDRNQVPAGRDLAFVGGGLLLIRLETLREVGLFDESFFVYGEDYDWGARMRKHGYRLAYSTDAVVWHKGSVTVARGSPFQDYHQVRGTLGFVRKHKRHLLPAALCYSLVRSLAPKVARRQWMRAGAVLRAYRDHFRAAS